MIAADDPFCLHCRQLVYHINLFHAQNHRQLLQIDPAVFFNNSEQLLSELSHTSSFPAAGWPHLIREKNCASNSSRKSASPISAPHFLRGRTAAFHINL